ncbi:MAG: cation transporter [Candidatus Marinimicrobia bacterium]|nr:cation transporter [Candidatus Neomarinimicrobiota bacterium]
MSHSHERPHPQLNETRIIGIAFFLNLFFTILEIIGGFFTNSIAILSDALHDFGDSLALGLSYLLQKLSNKGSNQKYSYGYRRYSILAAVINSIILLTGSVFIIRAAIPRLIHPIKPHAEGMILFAILGILVNGAAVLQLRKGQAMNIRVVSLHLIEDVLGWFAVLIVSVVLLFTDLYILDPILSIIISVYIVYHVIANFKISINVFLQVVPNEVNTAALEEKFKKIERVRSVHHTHVWTLDGVNHVLTTHVVVDQDISQAEAIAIKSELKHIAYDMHCEHVTLEIEYSDEDCSMNHEHCDHD